MKALKVNFGNEAKSEEVVFVEDGLVNEMANYLNTLTEMYCDRQDMWTVHEVADIVKEYGIIDSFEAVDEEYFNWIKEYFGLDVENFEDILNSLEDNGSKLYIFKET